MTLWYLTHQRTKKAKMALDGVWIFRRHVMVIKRCKGDEVHSLASFQAAEGNEKWNEIEIFLFFFLLNFAQFSFFALHSTFLACWSISSRCVRQLHHTFLQSGYGLSKADLQVRGLLTLALFYHFAVRLLSRCLFIGECAAFGREGDTGGQECGCVCIFMTQIPRSFSLHIGRYR